MRSTNFNKLGLGLLLTVEGYRRHRSLSFLLEEYDRRCVILAPVYEAIFEQLGRSLWRLMFETERRDEEEAAELLDVIRKWEEKVRESCFEPVAVTRLSLVKLPLVIYSSLLRMHQSR